MMSSMIRSSIERSARAPVPLVTACAARARKRILRHAEPHAFHREELGVLLDHRVLRLGQNRNHLFFGQRIERGHDRQTSDKFRNHPEAQASLPAQRAGPPPSASASSTSSVGLPKPIVLLPIRFCTILSSPTNAPPQMNKNFLRIDLDVFLVRMFAAALRRNVAGAAFENFQQRLLHAFARNIARDADVVGLAADLVDFVDVNDADLGALHVVIGILEQAQNDVLHVFADVTGFGQGGRIRDAERHIENLGERLRQQASCPNRSGRSAEYCSSRSPHRRTDRAERRPKYRPAAQLCRTRLK